MPIRGSAKEVALLGVALAACSAQEPDSARAAAARDDAARDDAVRGGAAGSDGADDDGRGDGTDPLGAGGALGADPPHDSGAPSNPLDAAAASDAGAVRGVQLVEGQLVVDGAPFFMRGVCYNPVPRGATHPAGVDFAGLSAVDLPLLERAGVNVIRTYVPLVDRAVLDAFYAAGIRVINGVFVADGPTEDVVARVDALKDHPAILMWSLGNEWNYNGLYVGLSHEASLARLNEVAGAVRAADPDHPIATLYGELPEASTVAAMPDIDVWGINVYRGLGFGELFSEWAALSDKPLFVSEYGADAYDARVGAYDPESQALAVATLTRALAEAPGRVLGGTVFEWADEWWKVTGGSPAVQDVGGSAPGGGPYPDLTFNEEWWGLVDIDRNPRPAYEALREAFLAGGP